MAHYAREEDSFEFVKTGNQQIKAEDDYLNLAVTMSSTKDTVELADADDEIKGSITGFSRDKKQVRIAFRSRGLKFKNSGTAAIAVGSKIVGATRTVSGDTKYGYVKAFASAVNSTINKANVDIAIDAAIKAKGTVRDGGSISMSNEDSSADVIVSFPE